MSEELFNKLRSHIGHKIVIARYGDVENIWNIAVECDWCNEVLIDVNNPDLKED